MKKSELVFNVVLLPLDFLAILSAALTAYLLRFKIHGTLQFFTAGLTLHLREYVLISLIVAIVFILFMAGNGLYVLKNTRRIYGELFKVFVSISSASLALIIFLFFSKEFDTSRFIVVAVWVLSILFVSVVRVIVRIIQRLLFRKGKYVRKVVLIGDNHATHQLHDTYEKNPYMGYRVVADIPQDSIEHTIQHLKQLKNSHNIDEVIQANPKLTSSDIERLVDYCYDYHVDFKYTPDLFESMATNISIQTVSGIPIIEIKKTALEGWGRVAKRIIDIIGAIFAIIILGIPMIITALIVGFDSGWPVIYKNERVNQKGKVFKVYKFRSYKKEYCTGQEYGGKKASEIEDKLAEKVSTRKGPLHKIDPNKDFRLTRVAPLIRKTSLDELPQFFNVLKGDLSLVGPRPHMPKEVAKYEQRQKRVLTIKPGITGLPQINGRSDLDFEEEVRLDMYYIENWSFFLDLKILLMTPFALLRPPKSEQVTK
jgi:exopolysaccharide biosynthesis polyprenyl glycosylphosphotransferase